MRSFLLIALLSPLLFTACQTVAKYGRCYQQTKDPDCLKQVLTRMEAGVDTAYVKEILGEPIDMGFDYRYLVDEQSEEGCPMGAVFHIGDGGKVSDMWFGAICE